MDAKQFIDLVLYGWEQQNDETLEKVWITLYPFMLTNQLKFMPLQKFKDSISRKNIDNRSIEEIERDIEKAREKFEKEVMK